MTTLLLDLPSEVYAQLQNAATRQGKSVELLAQEWLVERSAQAQAHNDVPPVAAPGECAQAIAVLRQAGLLADLSPAEKARAAQATLTLEEARAILNRAVAKPLSAVVLELRGPKE